MADYQKMYIMLFNTITDVISVLQKVQQATEEQYISAEESNITVLKNPDADNSKT